ncbi:uncharacterized protein LOC110269058 isoform X4 [Arachis ipaensis]|uniref:uncharacterized protein LOC110269058 isoform X4 n=1 Tax=Arachis ipaensis TaxID=130454 RepID=UPI000A2B6BC1|nr:uncharacterized protein LOC110269058 isoform X4 [Arachis ipaensis]
MPSVSGIQFSLALKATLLEKDARNCEDKDHGSLKHELLKMAAVWAEILRTALVGSLWSCLAFHVCHFAYGFYYLSGPILFVL